MSITVGAGCTQGEVDRATRPLGLAVPCGVFPATGIAGLTLGGGHGYLSRKYGLTIDSLIGANVVLADGTAVVTNATENPDLLWALRGGGGNFGVVTSFVFQVHRVGTVHAGPILWDEKHARRIIQWYRDFLPRASEDFYAFLSLQTVPSTEPHPLEMWGKFAVGLVFCISGSRDDQERLVQTVRHELPNPIFDGVEQMPFHDLQGMAEGAFEPGLHWYWKGAFLKTLSDAAIEIHLERFAEAPSPISHVHFYPIDGAVHRVGKNETAWNCRDATWSLDIAAVDADGSKALALKNWARAYLEALHPTTLGGGYVNFMMDDENESRVKATYGDNHARLRSLKRKYDPTNLFSLNQNIAPAAPAA
jgi:FAD/FMN-containing dehydrogenase